jgi:arylsulfatase
LGYGDWKFRFVDQDKWFNGVQQSLVTPVITNLKLDPFERFEHARGFDEWQENRSYLITPAVNQIAVFLQTLRDYPPRQMSFDANLDQMMESLMRDLGELAKPASEVEPRLSMPGQ